MRKQRRMTNFTFCTWKKPWRYKNYFNTCVLITLLSMWFVTDKNLVSKQTVPVLSATRSSYHTHQCCVHNRMIWQFLDQQGLWWSPPVVRVKLSHRDHNVHSRYTTHCRSSHISHPRRTLSQLKKYNFSGERKNHWPGRCNRIKRMIFLPSRGHFRK
jgi:hypothetical protein